MRLSTQTKFLIKERKSLNSKLIFATQKLQMKRKLHVLYILKTNYENAKIKRF